MTPHRDSLRDFDHARRQVFIQRILGFITGRPQGLLPFGEVRRRLRLRNTHYKGLQEVPLDRIIGSVGRYHDFTRTFLPRRENLRERWANVEDRVVEGKKLPPVELFQVGDAYFVRDGNHRVSVARTRGTSTIKAAVWEYEAIVPLEPDTNVDDLLIKQECVEFLEHTHLDELPLGQRIELCVPGAYQELQEHIDVHRYHLEQARGREVSYEEAAIDWYDAIYRPVVEAIREHDVLPHFPARTEADLYIWAARYQQELSQHYGRPVPAGKAVDDWSSKGYPTSKS